MAVKGKIKCTFVDCYQHFGTEKEMKKHKKYASEHDYCNICDIDFDDYDKFTVHKAFFSGKDARGKLKKDYEAIKRKTGKEVAELEGKFHKFGCAMCGQTFSTESGRQRHTDGVHPVDQNIACSVGCGQTFPRAAGLIFHLENGLCPKITAAEYKGHLQHKDIISRLLQDPTEMERIASKDNSSLIDAAKDEEIGGGVSLLLDAGPDVEWDEDDQIRPLVPEKPMVPQRMPVHLQNWPELKDVVGTGMETLSIKNGSEHVQNGNSELKVETWSLPSGCKKGDPLPSPPKTWSSKSAASKVLFPKAKDTPRPANWEVLSTAIAEFDHKTNLLYHQFWNPAHKDYNAERFWDCLIEKYKCPLPNCTDYFDTAHETQSHIKSTHTVDKAHCPKCQKLFKSYASLIAHCEAPNSRCGISYTNKYGQVIDQFSGGFLKAEANVRPDLDCQKDGYSMAYMKYEATVPHDYRPEVEGSTIGTGLT